MRYVTRMRFKLVCTSAGSPFLRFGRPGPDGGGGGCCGWLGTFFVFLLYQQVQMKKSSSRNGSDNGSDTTGERVIRAETARSGRPQILAAAEGMGHGCFQMPGIAPKGQKKANEKKKTIAGSNSEVSTRSPIFPGQDTYRPGISDIYDQHRRHRPDRQADTV